MNMYVKEEGCDSGDCIHMALDRDKCWAPLNTIYLQVPYVAGIFLINELSRWSLPREFRGFS
jgi:hypothetical protein